MTLKEILEIADRKRDVILVMNLLMKYFRVDSLNAVSRMIDSRSQIVYHTVRDKNILTLVRVIEEYCKKNSLEHINLTEKLQNEFSILRINNLIANAKDKISKNQDNFIEFNIETFNELGVSNEIQSKETRELKFELKFKKESEFFWCIIYITDEFNEYEAIKLINEQLKLIKER